MALMCAATFRLRSKSMAANPDPIVILSYARTPMGSFQGALSGVSATELGATAVKAAVERAGLKGEDIDKVFMGNVLPAGLGQAPARQAALGAGLPRSAEAVTVNKVCGSGMQAAMFAHDMVAAAPAGRGAPPGGGRGLGAAARRRRHGEHAQRAVFVEKIPRRHPHRPRHGLRSHDARR